MEEALVAKLLDTTALTALVGERIYWLDRPQGTAVLPQIVLQDWSADHQITMEGPNPLRETLVQIDCWGASQAESLMVGRELIAALEGARFTQDSIDFPGIFFVTRRRTIEPGGTQSASRYYRTSIDFRIWHSELA